MADKPTYAPPLSPPPNYQTPKPQHHDAGPYYPGSTASPAPGPHNQMNPYNYNSEVRAPDPAYGGYYNNNPQGPYGPPPQGYYGPGQNQGGYYGQPGPQPGMGPPGGYYGYPQQPMYVQQHPGYYQDNRSGAGSGICAGIMGALACCCCLDLLF